ncbi:MAG: precorrin-6A reductase [Halanaerobiales bacterium]|nr:precorrin-6A reductase [Halanaerobiales bacterium]
MILLMAGTSEGRELASVLHQRGYPLLVSTVSEYAVSLLEKGIESIHRPLGVEELIGLIEEKKISVLIDATHPFAVVASQNAQNAVKATGIYYLRWERESLIPDEIAEIKRVKTYEDALKHLEPFERILLTIGSKELPLFDSLIQNQMKKVYARVLPLPSSLKTCWDLGIPPGQIIACQGPFSMEMNIALIHQYNIQVLVTKNSGKRGGLREKLEAAVNCGISVILIEKPDIKYIKEVNTLKEIEEILRKLGFNAKNEE